MTSATLRDERRLAAIERYDVLERPPRRDLVALADLAARLADVPRATINLITDDEQRQVATVGFAAGVCSREDSMCRLVVETEQPIHLEDASLDARFRHNPFTTGELDALRFYASHPLVTPDHVVIGTLCVFDDEPHPPTPELVDGLALLADRVVDVLELELTSRRLAESNEQLRRANERLAAFAGQVSHDLKNPLLGVRMALELVRGRLGEEVRQPDLDSLLDRAARTVGRMQSLINGLLEFARTGSRVLDEPVDLAATVAAVREDLAAHLPGAVLRVDGLPVVRGDGVQLRALLQNLVDNAVKFTPPDRTPEVAVSGRRTPEGWRIEVADRGPGIPEARRGEVFDPLVRLDADVPGSGIGLATARRVVEAHGGRIGIDDNPGGGTVVWFELPD